jgi:hypothetical protein
MLQAAPVQRIAGSNQPVGAKLAANWTFRGDGLTDAIDRILTLQSPCLYS